MAVNNSISPVSPQSPLSPEGSPYVYPRHDKANVATLSKRPKVAGKTVAFPENPVSHKTSGDCCNKERAVKSVLKKGPPSPISDGPLQEYTAEEKKILETERLTTLFHQNFKKALEDPEDEESITDCTFTLMNSKRLFATALTLVDVQEKSHQVNREVIDKILRLYLFTQASATTRGKLPDIIKQVEFRLTHSNLEEIVEYLVASKKQYKIDSLALLEVAGNTVPKFSELKAKIIPAYQEVFKDDAMKLRELLLDIIKQSENSELYPEAVACMIRIYQKGLSPDPIDQLNNIFKDIKLKTDQANHLKKLLLSQFLNTVQGFRYLSQVLSELLRNEIIDKASEIKQQLTQVETGLENALTTYEEYGVDIIRLLNSAWHDAIRQREKNVQGIVIGQGIVQSVKGKRLLRLLVTDPDNGQTLSGMASCLLVMDQHGKDAVAYLAQILSTIQNPVLKAQLNNAIVLKLQEFQSAADQLIQLFVKNLIDKSEADLEPVTIDATTQYLAKKLGDFAQKGINVSHLIEYSWYEAKNLRSKVAKDYSLGEMIIRNLKTLYNYPFYK